MIPLLCHKTLVGMKASIIGFSLCAAVIVALSIAVTIKNDQLEKEKNLTATLTVENLYLKSEVTDLQFLVMERTQQLEEYLTFADSLANIGGTINVETAQRIGALRNRFGL